MTGTVLTVGTLTVRSRRPTRVRFPADVWGRACEGVTGATQFDWRVAGASVSHRYRADRTAFVSGRVGPLVTLRVDGVGGLQTAGAHRRQGYATALLTASLAASAQAGYDCALLFARPALASWYASLGWTLIPTERVRIRHADHDGLWPCASTVIVGMRALSRSCPPPATLLTVAVTGLPW